MNINNGSQNLKKFMKETFATRSVNFDFQGPIFRLFSHKVVRNCYLIFILHTMFFYRDILELTQANILSCVHKSSFSNEKKNYYPHPLRLH